MQINLQQSAPYLDDILQMTTYGIVLSSLSQPAHIEDISASYPPYSHSDFLGSAIKNALDSCLQHNVWLGILKSQILPSKAGMSVNCECAEQPALCAGSLARLLTPVCLEAPFPVTHFSGQWAHGLHCVQRAEQLEALVHSHRTS